MIYNLSMSSKEIYEAFRKALVDILIPEIKELQKGQVRLENKVESLTGKVESLTSEVASLGKEMNLRFEMLERGQKAILDKLDLAQRVAKLETRLDEISKKVA